MKQHHLSYLKTSALAGGAGVAALLVAWLLSRWLPPALALPIAILAGLVAAVGWAIAAGGLIALYRDHRDQHEDVDLFRVLNRPRSEPVVASAAVDPGLMWRRLTRWLPGRPALLVGDTVEVRSYEEIARTLDEQGCVDALPFMAEMKRFCGQRGRVLRMVDKIYNYGRGNDLRRLEDTFLLTGLRCNGSAHGGCQARCALMWKAAWLKRVDAASEAQNVAASSEPATVSAAASVSVFPVDAVAQAKYVCQFTELGRATTPLAAWDIRQDLRPLLAGNVTLASFLVATLTQIFNAVQRRRGGVTYPHFASGVLASTPAVTHGLQAGDTIRVLGPQEIHRTLDKGNRNRGLWFDLDMLKHCGKTYSVLARVDRLIDSATGQMRLMKSPCIILEHAEYSGEPLRFCSQEEHPYWREAWLAPLARGTESAPVVDRYAQRAANQF